MANLQSLTVNDPTLVLPGGTNANRPSLFSNTAIQWTNTGTQAFTVLAGTAGTVSNTSWTCPAGVTQIEVLVVAGGGGGGFQVGGGGGAGGVIYNSAFPVTPTVAYTVTVGAGGTGAANGSTAGTNGSNSAFGSLTAVGGGRGANHDQTPTPGGLGLPGGSGGGGSGNNSSIAALGGSGTPGQGHSGGRGRAPNGPNFGDAWLSGDSWAGGGGGGAGGPGLNSTVNAQGGAGGPGVQYSISGSPTFYGGGGGGCNSVTGNPRAPGGMGGGGAGVGNAEDGVWKNGTASTGGGGGGVRDTSGAAGNGGSGTVIIRYSLATATTTPVAQARFNTVVNTLETYNTNNRWNIQLTGDNIVTNGLVLHLDGSKFNSSSSDWLDLSGYNNNSTLVNGPTYNSANGGSIVFDGNNDHVTVDSFAGKPLNHITCEGWIFPTRTPSTGTIRGALISASNSMYLGIIDSQDSGRTHALHWANQTTSSRTGSFVGSIPNNQWSHIAGTFDGIRCKGYINGVLVYDVAQTGTVTDGNYYVGAYAGSVANITDGTHNWLGRIGAARIYNRALSDVEIQQNYSAQSSRFNLPTYPILDGTTADRAAASAAAIKAINPSVKSGVYWLRVPNVNNSEPFRIYCDFTMDSGRGYAIVYNNYFTGSEAGPRTDVMNSKGLQGNADKFNDYFVAPSTMMKFYNNGVGCTRMAVFATTNNGPEANGITGSSTVRWVAFTGPSAAQFASIWTSTYGSNQFTGTFVSADGNSGTAWFPNSHGNGGGVVQISTNNATVNNYILYEYKYDAGLSDPNHWWLVGNGRDGDTYFVVNGTYSGANVLNNRLGGVAIF